MNLERALTLEGEGEPLVAIFHSGAALGTQPVLGVLVVVGGPQYRVGSHRQFVHLARDLAAEGVPVLRLDITGMGDSGGEKKNFEALDEDIRRGIDALLEQQPELRGVVLWGLCDGASAALMYAPRDQRVRGLVLANPWLENAEARARTHLLDYYRQRLLSPIFWRRLFSGRLALVSSAREFIATSRSAFGGSQAEEKALRANAGVDSSDGPATGVPYQVRMLESFNQLQVRLCWLLSGQDLTAGEFERHYRADARWRKAAAGRDVLTRRFPEADHTFSRREWKREVAAATLEFVKEIEVELYS